MNFSIFSLKNERLITLPFDYSLTPEENMGNAIKIAIKQNISLSHAKLDGAIIKNENFRDLDFRNSNLRGAVFYETTFNNCDFFGTKLSGASFNDSQLFFCDFYLSDMEGVKFTNSILKRSIINRSRIDKSSFDRTIIEDVTFHNSNLREADFENTYFDDSENIDFKNADLVGAKFRNNFEHSLAYKKLNILPEEGSFIGWKKCRNNVVLKLLIPENARRVNTTKRNCRASFVEVLDIIGDDKGISLYDEKVIYERGKIIYDDWFDSDWRNEETHGIHFFLTRKEAEMY